MSIPLTDVVYPLDTSGLSPSNRIRNERHELTTTSWTGFNLIIPKAAPFFDDSIPDGKLIHYPSGAELLRGRDWITGWMFQSAAGEIGQFISSCIYIFDTNLKGHVEIPSYQCLGGEWQINLEQLKAILAEKLLNPQRYYWEYVAKLPQIFRPLDHDEDIDSFSELGDLLDELQNISRAIIQSSESGSLDLHIAQKNPHKTGPGDLTYPLDLLRNWNPATLLEMSDSTALPADRYVTPPGVMRLIENTALAALTAFSARRDNPNKVTAHQTGTLDEDEINALIQDYLTGGTGALNAATLQGRDLAGIVSEVTLAVDPILKESYDKLYEEISAILQNVVATDTALFAGLNQGEWERRITDLIEAQSLVIQFEAVYDMLFPEWTEPGEVLPDITITEKTTTLIASFSEDTVANVANTNLITVIVDKMVIQFVVHGLTKQVVAWSNVEQTAGYRFFLDESGTSDEMRLWVEAPAARPGIIVINNNPVTTVISDGTTIYGPSSLVQPTFNTPSNITLKVHASMADIAMVVQAQAALGVRMTNAEQRLSTSETDIVNLKARPVADLILVNGISDVNPGASVEFDLEAAIVAAGNPYQFDMAKAVVSVRIKNTDADSPNYESWINGETACSYGVRKDFKKAFVYNHTGAAVKAFVRVTVPKA